MFFTPIQYDEPVFRPPGEANSVILQATTGCSWNRCAFCEMYTSKQFRIRTWEELQPEIQTLAKAYQRIKKVFLADGNAFVIPAAHLITLLDEINEQFGRLQRVSAYALPKDIRAKTETELQAIRQRGLKLLYIGIETGDDALLQMTNKGETFDSTVEGIHKAHQAGLDTSLMIINGLGGKRYSEQHAIHSAHIINQLMPKFLSTLTLYLPYSLAYFQKKFKGTYQPQSVRELIEELKLFIQYLNTEHTIYRSDHVSNNVILKGTLSKDQPRLIKELEQSLRMYEL